MLITNLASNLWFSILIPLIYVFSAQNFHQLLRHVIWFFFGSIISFAVLHYKLIHHISKLILFQWFFKKYLLLLWTYRSTGIVCQPPWNKLQRTHLQSNKFQTSRSQLGQPHNWAFLRIFRWWNKHRSQLPFRGWLRFWSRRTGIRLLCPKQPLVRSFSSTNWMHLEHWYRTVYREWRTWYTHSCLKTVKIAPNTRKSISYSTKYTSLLRYPTSSIFDQYTQESHELYDKLLL